MMIKNQKRPFALLKIKKVLTKIKSWCKVIVSDTDTLKNKE